MINSSPYVENNRQVIAAIELANKGDLQSASLKLVELLKLEPKNHFIRINLAQIYFLMNQFEPAEECLDQYLNSGEMIYFDFYLQAVSNLLQMAVFRKAIKWANKLTQLYPNNLQSWWTLVEVAHEGRAYDKAIQAANEFIKRAPEVYEMKAFLANIMSAQGAFKDAEQVYLEVLENQPSHSIALYGLSRCKSYKDQTLDILKRCQQAKNLIQTEKPEDKESMARVCLAQAKIYNDNKEYKKAWQSASEGKSILNSLYPFSPQAYTVTVEQILEVFKQQRLDTTSEEKDSPILIVGMPRSGTTLIEQLLSLDKKIYPAGEKQGIEYAFASHFGAGDLIEQISSATDDDYHQLAIKYKNYYQQFANFSGSRIVDKVPRNYLYLGIFKRMFPNIKVLNLARNKLDNATSIFFEHFSSSSNYTNSIENILHVRDQYEHMMEVWQQLLPNNILTLEYEKLVQDFPYWRQKIVTFCDLDIDETLDFTQSENKVETPSVWQVRQGVFSSSIGRWKRYSEFLVKYID